jgi:hypothetical protein
MKVQHGFVLSLVVLSASLMLFPVSVKAQLLPPGDFRGKSLDEWGLDWAQWGVATGLGGQTLPDTVDGVRYLPPNFGGGDFVTDVTIREGTPIVVAPFFVSGERYDDGSEDNPADPILGTIFEETTFRSTFDGNVVLEGSASDFPERTSDVTVFSQPILYTTPQPRGPELNAVAAIFGKGLTTIFDGLPLGEHTLRNEFDSSFFGQASFTYNITVVPEPSTIVLLGSVTLGSFVLFGRRRVQAQA